jgi:hypothetical protein
VRPVKWVFTHEPAILAGIIAALAVFFSVRYGTHTDAAMQGTLGGLVLTIFGTLRNFVTSPATKQALDNAPGQIAPIADDVTYLKQFVGEMITHPGGLVGMLAANRTVHASPRRPRAANHGCRSQQPGVPCCACRNNDNPSHGHSCRTCADPSAAS